MPDPRDPTCIVLQRRRGRPPRPQTAAVSTRLNVEDLDRVIRLATRNDMKVAAFLREVVRVYLHELLY